MAKRNKSKGSKPHKTRVHPIDARANALRSFLGLTPSPNLASDRRTTYSPDYIPSTPTSTVEAPVRVVFGPETQSSASRSISHIAPAPVRPQKTICARRQERKEVIHAFNHAGKAGQKAPKRTPNSNIHCKG